MRKLLAVLMAVVMTTPAFAAVQNVKVSGSVASSYVNRANFDFDQAGQDYKQSYFYTTTRLRVDADLSDNVSTTVGLVNELPWGDNRGTSAAEQNIDIEYAYATLREMLYSPLTVVVGRQDLHYGNGFLVGKGGGASAGALNTTLAADLARTVAYDGIRAILDYKPLTLDLVYAKINSNNLTGLQSAGGALKDDVDFFGVNANYQLGDAMNTVVEGYFFGRIGNASSNAANGVKGDTLYVPGLRASTSPIEGLTVGLEAAMQFGNRNITNTNVAREDAWALQAKADYALPVLEAYKPVAGVAYTFVTGDQDPANVSGNAHGQASSEKYTAWDPLFNDQNIGRIWRSIMNYTNLHVAEFSLSASPIEDVTVKGTWTGLWNDTQNSFNAGAGNGAGAFTLPDGSATTPVVTTNHQVGYELDGDVTYQYTEDVKFGLSVGFFKPGELFDGANDETATQAIASVAVNF